MHGETQKGGEVKTIIGIDPGASGGIAWRIGGSLGTAIKMPETDADVVEQIRDIAVAATVEGGTIEAHVEKVGGFICGNPAPGSAMFRFGWGAGLIEGALRAFNIRTIYVRPQEWQKTFSLGTKKDCASKGAWKQKLRAESQRRFPHLKVTLKTADALLILEYATLKSNGQ